MIVSSEIKMLAWVRFLIISILATFLSHKGFSQDIIYDGNAVPSVNNVFSQTQSQIVEQPRFPQIKAPLQTDIPSFVSEKEVGSKLNLFDLTATISENRTDNQSDALAIESSDSILQGDNDAVFETSNFEEQGDTNENQSETSELFDSNTSRDDDNKSDLDKLISELFPIEQGQLSAQKNVQSDNVTLDDVTKTVPEEQLAQDNIYATPAVSVGLRDLSGVGLVTTGIANWQQREMPFSTLLWSGSKPKHIQYLFQNSEPFGASETINSLVYSSVIRKSAPPSGVAGNSELAFSLVINRIEWLARAGHSEALADLIRKLPEDDQKWDKWQRWLGAYDLLSYNDSVTCDKADKKVSENFDAFWLKVQIVCKIIDGAYEDAIFLAELMGASGINDPLFFALLENFHSAKSGNFGYEDSSLTPLHLSLMDLAEAPIEWHQVSELPSSMMYASNLIKNTTREARLAFAMKQILQQSETAFQAAALIRSLYNPENPMETAFSILANTKGDLRLIASAEIYAILAGSMFQAEVQQDYDLLFLAAYKEEVQIGNGVALLPFYADLAETRLTADSLPPVKPELKPQFEKMVLLNQLKNTTIKDMVISLGEMDKLFLLMNPEVAEKPPVDVLKKFDLMHLLPIFQQALMIQVPLSWMELASLTSFAADTSESFELEPVLKNALIEASESQRTAETILIISAMFGKQKLTQMSASDLALVIRSLQRIGFDKIVDNLVREIVTAHLVEKYWRDAI